MIIILILINFKENIKKLKNLENKIKEIKINFNKIENKTFYLKNQINFLNKQLKNNFSNFELNQYCLNKSLINFWLNKNNYLNFSKKNLNFLNFFNQNQNQNFLKLNIPNFYGYYLNNNIQNLNFLIKTPIISQFIIFSKLLNQTCDIKSIKILFYRFNKFLFSKNFNFEQNFQPFIFQIKEFLDFNEIKIENILNFGNLNFTCFPSITICY